MIYLTLHVCDAADRRLLSAFTDGDFRRLQRRHAPHVADAGVTSSGKHASSYASIATGVPISSLPTFLNRRRAALLKTIDANGRR